MSNKKKILLYAIDGSGCYYMEEYFIRKVQKLHPGKYTTDKSKVKRKGKDDYDERS